MTIREAGPLAVRFVGGVDTKSDRKTVPAGKLLNLENGVFTRALSIAKRHGYDALSKQILGTPPLVDYGDVRGLAARGAELVLFGESKLYSYVEAAARWKEIGSALSVSMTDRTLGNVEYGQQLPDYATCSSVGLLAWEDTAGSGIGFVLIDENDGSVLQGPTTVSATGTRPRCVRVGDKLALLWAELASTAIRIIVFEPAQPTIYDTAIYPKSVVTDLAVASTFDVQYVGALMGATRTNAAAFAYTSIAGLRVGFLDASGDLGSPVLGYPSLVTVTASTTITAVGVAASPHHADAIGYAYVDSTANDTLAGWITDNGGTTALTETVAATSLALAITGAVTLAFRFAASAAATDTIDVYGEAPNAVPRNSTITVKSLSRAGAVAAVSTTYGRLGSKAWSEAPAFGTASAENATYATICHDVPLFGVYLVSRHDGVVVARAIPGIAGDAPARTFLPSVVLSGTRTFAFAAIYKAALESVNNDEFTEPGVRVVELDFDDETAHQTVYAGDTLYLGGANQLAYDGLAVHDASFPYGLDWDASTETIATSAPGAGSISNGTRNYVFVPEITLANGEILVGPASKPVTVVLAGADDTTTLAVPTIRHGRAGTKARLSVFRTVAGDASAYYRVTSLDPTTAGAMNGFVANNPAVASVSFVDGMTDAVLATKSDLYTNGGILSNDPAGSSVVIAGGKGRLWWTDPSDPNLVRFSKERRDGHAFEIAPELLLQVDAYGGAITGIGFMDGNVIVFKRSAIYVVSGAGPLANPEVGGPGDSFSEARLITTDVGCVTQRSIASTPEGIVFQSAKGIYILTRALQAVYVGAPVESYNAQTITRATLVDDTTQVRFLTNSGRTLLFDYFFGQWSTWTNHEGADATIVGGVYYYLRNDGRVFKESSSSYYDDTLRVVTAIETAFLHFEEQLQGMAYYRRLMVLGEWRAAHNLSVQYRMGYAAEGDWSTPIVLACYPTMGGSAYGDGLYGDGNYGGTGNDAYQHDIHVGQRGQAIAFRFSDEVPIADVVHGASFELTEIVITGGIYGTRHKVPVNRSA